MPFHFRRATPADAAAVAALVNSAYRGDSSRAGWTTEADLLGGQRTDADDITDLIGAANALILLCLDGENLVGTAYLAKLAAKTAYLGMLTVAPQRQGRGIGQQIMAEAERLARVEWGANTMQMQVIALRHELIAYYERRDYRRTGETRPFPDNPRNGSPKIERQKLHLDVLEKTLE